MSCNQLPSDARARMEMLNELHKKKAAEQKGISSEKSQAK